MAGPARDLTDGGETGEDCMGETATVLPALAWSRTFPGRAEFVGEARHFLAGIMCGGPAADDAILCLSELAANAVTHSDSGRPGGQFTVSVAVTGAAIWESGRVRESDRVRIQVEDQGGQWDCSPREDGQHGRGLLIISRLASDWGIVGDGEINRIVWFELASPPSIP
jgi:serine/threonine-protein kinase RsbW